VIEARSILHFALLSILLVRLADGDDWAVPDAMAKVHVDFGQSFNLGRHKFQFENTTLKEIVKTVGSGDIRFNGKDAANGEYFVDYESGPDLVRFTSSAEMEGDDHGLEGIQIRPIQGKTNISHAPMLPALPSFSFGTVGVSDADLAKRLAPGQNSDGRISYHFAGKKTVRDALGRAINHDITSLLQVMIFNGRVIALEISHITSS
jgi:hypothetical protein